MKFWSAQPHGADREKKEAEQHVLEAAEWNVKPPGR